MVRDAFARAAARPRKKLTLVHKHNVLVHAGHLWRRTVEAVERRVPRRRRSTTCTSTRRRSSWSPTRRGSTSSSPTTCSATSSPTSPRAIAGGIGLAASGNINPDARRARACSSRCTARRPDIAGQGKADPTATVLSVALLLEHLGLADEAARVERPSPPTSPSAAAPPTVARPRWATPSPRASPADRATRRRRTLAGARRPRRPSSRGPSKSALVASKGHAMSTGGHDPRRRPSRSPPSDTRRPGRRSAEARDRSPTPGSARSSPTTWSRIRGPRARAGTTRRVEPYGPLPLDPATAVLHYAQEIFEGLKAYRHADGSVWTFRPEANAARFTRSARRLALPELPEEDFLGVARGAGRAPTGPGCRPARRRASTCARSCTPREAFLGVRPSLEVEFLRHRLAGRRLLRRRRQAGVDLAVAATTPAPAPGGTGAAKCGGNYAASLARPARGAPRRLRPGRASSTRRPAPRSRSWAA